MAAKQWCALNVVTTNPVHNVNKFRILDNGLKAFLLSDKQALHIAIFNMICSASIFVVQQIRKCQQIIFD